MTAGVHGRESITSLLCMKILEEYTGKEKLGEYNLSDIFNHVTIYFIPMLNPDGVEIAVNGFSSGPRSRDFYLGANGGNNNYRRWKANGRGVDLNNQFKADWDRVESRTEPHFENYKGATPESHPFSAGYKDWFIKEFKNPGFTIEIGPGKTEKPLPSNQLDKYYRENRYILLELASSL